MSRLLLRLLIFATAISAASTVLFIVLHFLFFGDNDMAYVNAWVRCFDLAVEQVENANNADRKSVLKTLERKLGYPVNVVSRSSTPEPVRMQLDAGKSKAFDIRMDAEYLYSVMSSSDRVLRFGPLPPQPVPVAELVVLLAVTAICFAGCFYLALRPWDLQQKALEQGAEAIARGRLETRIPENKDSLLPALTRSFNRMVTQTEEMILAQRELIRAVSHELRTPIARLRIGVHILTETADPDKQAAKAADLDRDLEQLNDLVEELLIHARMEGSGQKPNKLPINVKDFTDELVRELQDSRKPAILRRKAIEGRMQVQAEKKFLHRAVGNVVRNALRYARSTVLIDAHESVEGVLISVDDDGPGIPEAERERVFEPFTRLSDEGRHNHGMGLAIVKRAVSWHGGWVRVMNSELGGCRAETFWPRV